MKRVSHQVNIQFHKQSRLSHPKRSKLWSHIRIRMIKGRNTWSFLLKSALQILWKCAWRHTLIQARTNWSMSQTIWTTEIQTNQNWVCKRNKSIWSKTSSKERPFLWNHLKISLLQLLKRHQVSFRFRLWRVPRREI